MYTKYVILETFFLDLANDYRETGTHGAFMSASEAQVQHRHFSNVGWAAGRASRP